MIQTIQKNIQTISFENRDIIVIDPGYFISSMTDWERSGYGENLDMLIGKNNGVVFDCPIGDIACFPIRSKSGECLGFISTDSGRFCVADLDAVVEYTGDAFNYYKCRNVIIENFTGTVSVACDETGKFQRLTVEGTENFTIS